MLLWFRQHHGLQDYQPVLWQKEVQRPHHHCLRLTLQHWLRKTDLHYGEKISLQLCVWFSTNMMLQLLYFSGCTRIYLSMLCCRCAEWTFESPPSDHWRFLTQHFQFGKLPWSMYIPAKVSRFKFCTTILVVQISRLRFCCSNIPGGEIHQS